jgi:ATP-dependent exoDNAse (exonuclease V) beta subunit
VQKNFVVYKSSAGSGKTFTLVKEYLRIALSEDSEQPQLFKKILAVTFTNKAATEMKERITETLKSISEQDPTRPILMAELLCSELQINQHILTERSKKLLSQILHNYSDFAIGTIDSFTHKIIRTFAFDLKLPVNFNVETDTEDFYSKVVSALISKVGENKNLTQLLQDFSINNAGGDSSWDPEPGLLNFTSALKKEDAHVYIEKLQKMDAEELRSTHKTLKQKISEFQTYLKEKGQKGIELIRAKNLKDSNFHFGATGPQNIFKRCAELEFESLEKLIGNRIYEAITSGKWPSKSNTSSETAALESIIPQLNQLAKDIISYSTEHYRSYALYSLLEKNIHTLLLINELQSIVGEFKQDEQIIFISEFNEKISKVIADEPAPFIYERLGERYQHFLLDEFQDTSTLQWQNILPLLDNSLANGRFNLIVGDGKQSIYRWRNANVKQFNALPLVEGADGHELLSERQASLKRNYGEKILDTNFRSLARIVDFNNSFFDLLPKTLLSGELQSIYHFQSQNKKNETGGYVSIDTGILEREDLDQKNKSLLLSYVSQALKDGFSYSDVCIIVRGNEKGNSIANFLVEQSIPVISSESLLLKNSTEINCITSFIAALINPEDKINSASVVSYVCHQDTELLPKLPIHLKSLRNASLFDVLNTIGIGLKEELLARKNIFDACTDIISELKLHHKNPQYIRFFLDEVNDFLVNRSGSIVDFLSWWDKRKHKASVIIPEGTNAVRIMTIHKSKGLEFPVVIMPFVNWETFQHQQDWVDLEDADLNLPVALFNISSSLSNAGFAHVVEKEKEQQYLDNMNLLYVGFTRAVERLHIISCKSKTQKKDTVSDWINSYIDAAKVKSTDGKVEFGEIELKSSKHNSTAHQAFEISKFNFNNNSSLVKIKGSHKLNLSDDTEFAREKGIKMHYILSQIYSEKDIAPILSKMLGQGLITSDEKPSLEEKINQLLTHPLLLNYFKDQVSGKNEAEIITANSEILRPDKIILEKENAIVIDYKTGKENKNYTKQMLKYEQALLGMGYKSVKKILVYIEENRVEQLA